jgi:hypothetical protein
MKYVPSCTGRVVLSLAAGIASYLAVVAQAQVQSGQVLIQAVHGSATYSTGAKTLPLKENLVLTRGAEIKTGNDTTVDIILQYNGTVLRLLGNSTLSFDKLNKENAGEEVITETSLNLKSGCILGSQRKLAVPSSFEVNTPRGIVTIKGTEYVVRSDGAVGVLSGSVQVIYNLPGNAGSVKVTVPAGSYFDPASGTVKTGSITGVDFTPVRNNAMVFKLGGATIVIKPTSTITPTKGNNGVGNGIDPPPPGNPPVNDGPGTGPGNPGNRGGHGGNPHNP